MAKINKTEVTDRVIEVLRLDTARDKIPAEIADKILAVVNVNEKGKIRTIVDSTANDSDKTFTVPSGRKWDIDYIFVTITATATVGNRNIHAEIQDGTNTLLRSNGDVVVAESTTGRFIFSHDCSTTDSNSVQYMYFPKTVYENQIIEIQDRAAIDAAADDMTVVIVLRESSMEG